MASDQPDSHCRFRTVRHGAPSDTSEADVDRDQSQWKYELLLGKFEKYGEQLVLFLIWRCVYRSLYRTLLHTPALHIIAGTYGCSSQQKVFIGIDSWPCLKLSHHMDF